ncbi:MAG TPA: efflux transporter outer membrane subunit [Steroidobacteraceae bacterium]
MSAGASHVSLVGLAPSPTALVRAAPARAVTAVALLRCLGLLACLALPACSLMPRYHSPANPAPTSYQQFDPARRDCQSAPLGALEQPRAATVADMQSPCNWGPAHPSDQLPRSDWWREFGDPTLDALEAKVDAANPDLAAALNRYQQARALESEARSALFPTVSAQAYSNTDRQSNNRPLRSASQPDSYHDDLIGGALNYEIDLWGRVRSAVAAGAAQTQALSADLESVRLLLHARLALDYIALRGEDAQRSLLEQSVVAYGRALQMTSTRFEGGIASALDVAQAQTQLESARAALTDVIDQRTLLEHAIAALTGSIASDVSIAPGSLDLKLPSVPVAMPATLLERRPDVAAAERTMAVFNAGIGVARAAFFPRISLAALAGFESTQSAGLLGTPNRYWAIGPQAALTVFDAGNRRAVVAHARAQFEEAANDYRSAVLTAFREVEDALAQDRLLQQELEQQQAARSAAERALALSLNRYENGAVNYLQVVSSQIAALQAQRTALDLQTRELQASVDLVRALGGGWQADWPVTAQAQ